MSSFNQRECTGCGEPIDDLHCRWCTCERCGYNLRDGFCLFCNSRDGNSFAYDPNPNSSDYPPQPQYQTYSCELCGNDAHYGYDCPPQVPFIYNQDPCFNQNFDNNFPQTSPSFPQQYHCCENRGGPHATFQCQPMNQNFYNSNSSSFDQFQPLQYPVIHHPPQETSVEILQARENLMKSIQTFLKKFNRISFRETSKVLSLAWDKFYEIQHAQLEDLQELLCKLLKDVQIINEELAEYINSPENSSNAITPDLSTEELDNSLSMGDEHLDTIPETESDEVIKSSVEDLFPILRESKGIFDNMCDVHFCDKNHFDAESDLIESLLNRDTSTLYSPKTDPLLEEFADELAPINKIPPGNHEAGFNPEEDIRLVEQLLYDNSPPLDFLNDHFEIFSDFNDDCTSSDDDSFEDIDYVEAPPPDYELISLEEVENDILREKLLNINLLIAKIESLNDNPTPDCVLKSPFPFPIPVEDSDSFFEESDILPLIRIILYPNSRLLAIIWKRRVGELTSVVMEDILGEPHVHVPNVLPTHPTLMLDSDFIPSDDSLGSDLEVSFPSRTRNKIFDLGIFFEV
ncbi:hypothetical protein Tco_1336133 [Tanacetum coccineum]